MSARCLVDLCRNAYSESAFALCGEHFDAWLVSGERRRWIELDFEPQGAPRRLIALVDFITRMGAEARNGCGGVPVPPDFVAFELPEAKKARMHLDGLVGEVTDDGEPLEQASNGVSNGQH